MCQTCGKWPTHSASGVEKTVTRGAWITQRGRTDSITGTKVMVRSELIRKLSADHPDLPPETIQMTVDAVFETIIAALERGDRVEIRGFGSFTSKVRKAKLGRNPRTGETVDVEEKRVPWFKPGKLLRDRVDGKP